MENKLNYFSNFFASDCDLNEISNTTIHKPKVNSLVCFIMFKKFMSVFLLDVVSGV